MFFREMILGRLFVNITTLFEGKMSKFAGKEREFFSSLSSINSLLSAGLACSLQAIKVKMDCRCSGISQQAVYP